MEQFLKKPDSSYLESCQIRILRETKSLSHLLITLSNPFYFKRRKKLTFYIKGNLDPIASLLREEGLESSFTVVINCSSDQ